MGLQTFKEFCEAFAASQVVESVASTIGEVSALTDKLQAIFTKIADKENMPAKELAAILQHIEAVQTMAKEVLSGNMSEGYKDDIAKVKMAKDYKKKMADKSEEFDETKHDQFFDRLLSMPASLKKAANVMGMHLAVGGEFSLGVYFDEDDSDSMIQLDIDLQDIYGPYMDGEVNATQTALRLQKELKTPLNAIIKAKAFTMNDAMKALKGINYNSRIVSL